MGEEMMQPDSLHGKWITADPAREGAEQLQAAMVVGRLLARAARPVRRAA